jgi:hypothetical protein
MHVLKVPPSVQNGLILAGGYTLITISRFITGKRRLEDQLETLKIIQPFHVAVLPQPRVRQLPDSLDLRLHQLQLLTADLQQTRIGQLPARNLHFNKIRIARSRNPHVQHEIYNQTVTQKNPPGIGNYRRSNKPGARSSAWLKSPACRATSQCQLVR